MRQQIFLSNTFSRNVFPDNTNGEFTNVLNIPIPPRHSISVSEVYYVPKAWLNVRETNNEIIMKFSKIGRRIIVLLMITKPTRYHVKSQQVCIQMYLN